MSGEVGGWTRLPVEPVLCEECSFPIFVVDGPLLHCSDCGKVPLCSACYDTHAPKEEEE